MAKWTVSEDKDEHGRRFLTVEHGRKKLAVKLTEVDANKLVRYLLNKFDD